MERLQHEVTNVINSELKEYSPLVIDSQSSILTVTRHAGISMGFVTEDGCTPYHISKAYTKLYTIPTGKLT